jgi:hypothetical protein
VRAIDACGREQEGQFTRKMNGVNRPIAAFELLCLFCLAVRPFPGATNATTKVKKSARSPPPPHPGKYFPGVFFGNVLNSPPPVFSNSACRGIRETPKNALKRLLKKKKARAYFFCELAQTHVVIFPLLFFCRPLIQEPRTNR